MCDRPNILYVFTDQQSASTLSCMGNADLRTPAMDRLAAEGVMFATTYCTQPLCTPCRGSMFSGLMPHECGTWRNGEHIRAELRERSLGRVLSAAGYDCAYGGKWHVPEIAMPEDNEHGFRRICGFNDNDLAPACLEFLRRHRDLPECEQRPFFLVASFDNPHNICEWGRSMRLPWGSIGEPPPVEECPNLPPNFMPSAFEPEILRNEQACNWNIYPYRERSQEAWRRLRWAYFRLVEKVDVEIGKILSALDSYGLAENTVVIFSSDHGDGHGAHQWNQKSSLIEEVVRVPMVIRAPGGVSGVVDREHLVSNALDLFPTVCDYAGVPVPAGMPGLSLRSLVAGGDEDKWREAVFVETFLDGGRGYSTHGRAVRSARHKYVVFDRGRNREQLFDLVSDPGEMVNLAVEARHRGILETHRELLRGYVETTNDRFFVPEPGASAVH